VSAARHVKVKNGVFGRNLRRREGKGVEMSSGARRKTFRISKKEVLKSCATMDFLMDKEEKGEGIGTGNRRKSAGR